MKLRSIPILFLAALLACSRAPRPAPTVIGFHPAAEELVHPPGLPPLYKWMLAPDLQPAHWLGARLGGRELVEPLNVILVDRRATGPEEATAALSEAMTRAGFPSRMGHSGGYLAFVDGRLRPQLPATADHAFADEPFELSNNHGRLFGPVPVPGGFVFVGAFSREGLALLDKVKHRYLSFNQARDRLVERLDARTDFKRVPAVDLRNHLEGDPVHCTGDHDGRAARLERR